MRPSGSTPPSEMLGSAGLAETMKGFVPRSLASSIGMNGRPTTDSSRPRNRRAGTSTPPEVGITAPTGGPQSKSHRSNTRGPSRLRRRADFEPKAAICRGAQPHTWGGARSLAQQRLRDLTIIYLLMTGVMVFWKYAILRDPDPTQAIPYAIALAALGGIVSILSLPRPLSPSLLQVLELGMIGMLAAVFAFAQYHAMLDFSLCDDPVRASS